MRIITTSFAQFEIHQFLIIVRINEGVDLNKSYLNEIIRILKLNMIHPFGWISDKVNSYSVDPSLFNRLIREVSNFMCFCNVVYGDDRKDLTTVGSAFFPDNFPMAAFHTLEDAALWVNHTIHNKPHIQATPTYSSFTRPL